MKVALVQGGVGSEQEVSRVTGAAFEKALKELSLDYVVIDAGRDLPEKLMQAEPDVALLALHGKYGEDGTVQGICEYLKIPYTGSGVMASAIAMDKAFTKMLLQQEGIPTPKFELLDFSKISTAEICHTLPLPVVVKPSRDGSSMGTSLIYDEKDFLPAVELARQYDNYVLVEELIEGSEITIPLLDGRMLTAIEIVPRTDFYNYENKYTVGNTEYFLPARVDSAVIEKCNEYSLKIIDRLRLRSYSRVDFMLSKQGEPYLIEVNTLPGCTPTSLFPRAAKHEGIEFAQVIKMVIDSAGLDYAGLR